jgi:hypothetical protein
MITMIGSERIESHCQRRGRENPAHGVDKCGVWWFFAGFAAAAAHTDTPHTALALLCS